MTPFGRYAECYDLFYRDKDYRGEAAYVDRAIRRWRPQAASLLELGCGTGRYSEVFAERGYTVVGVDRSEEMLRRARARFAGRPDLAGRVHLQAGDLRHYRDGAAYDAVVALFHVVGYMETDADLAAAFSTARRHLKSGGIFAFDCWHGPGVLRDPPRNPVREVASGGLRAVRRTTAVLDPENSCTQVRFEIELWDREAGGHASIVEDHRMRHLFTPDVERLGAGAGMTLVAAHRWLTDRPLDPEAWYAFFMLQRSAVR